MPRTTPSAVAAIIETEPGISLDPFIETANALVTEILVPLGYDDTRLELIERWLSAHFYAIRDQRRLREIVSGIGETFQTKVGLYLNLTIYGQQAQVLDTKGGLRSLNDGRVTPRIMYIGEGSNS